MALYMTTLCLVGLVVVAHGFNDDDKQKIKGLILDAAQGCAKQEGITESDIEIMKTKKIPDTKTGACFAKCMLESFGLMKDGEYSTQGVIDAATPFVGDDKAKMDKVSMVADKCKEEIAGAGETDPCQRAKKIVECTHKHKEELGLDVMESS